MRRVRAPRAALRAVALAFVAAPLAAQDWNSERALALARQATELRLRQIADSGLVDYRATAHGYLTFLAQLGEGLDEPPRVLKADELALDVFWRAPNRSKQRIVGRRDTTLLPTDIAYHRDHLGIVQNNFPAIIRLGDGDEVRDVPHPLSAVGLRVYDFAIADSLRIGIPGRVISVYEVKVRPKDDRQPRVIGALYLDRDNAQVVRMALSFTRAAFLDRQLEDLFVVLENALVGTRYWLPRRQEIEIRRTATWLDYPVRGIIRGRWEIRDYELNPGLPLGIFGGPEIVQAPPEELGRHVWTTPRILDSLPPDVRAATAAETRRVQAEVRALVREQALRRARGSALAARSASDFVRFNRAEGFAVGAGLRRRVGRGLTVTGTARHGFADHETKGRLELAWEDGYGRAVRGYAVRELRDVGDVPERSLLVNSIAAQEAGSDYTDPVLVTGFGGSLTFGRRGAATRWTLDVAHEEHRMVGVAATPVWGGFEQTLPADSMRRLRVRLALDRPTRLWYGGWELRARAEARAFAGVWRAAADVELQREMGGARLVTRTIGGVAHSRGAIPAQELVFLGGPVSAPGYAYHALVGDGAVSQRIELQAPVPFPAISLGRFGRSAARATLSPFVTAVALDPANRVTITPTTPLAALERVTPRASGVYPSAGVGLLLFFDIVRLDVARGLRWREGPGNGRWTFSIDVNRAFWRVL